MDWDEISTPYREPPIDVSYQVSVHLAKSRFLKICIEINAFSDPLQTWTPQAILVSDWLIF
jgi:hypothetical protein